MSKRKNRFLILIILAVVLATGLFLPHFVKSEDKTYADSNSFLKTEFEDSCLYNKLREVSGMAVLNANTFKDTTELDLSFILSGAPEQKGKITSLTDLKKFDLRKLEILKLPNNDIDNIEADIFVGMSSLEYLDISNNNLTNIDISELSNLKVLILNNNKLTSLDVSTMKTTGYEGGSSILNISHNNFSAFSNVTLPIERTDSNFDIIGYANNFTDIESISGKFNYILGIQGVNKTCIDQSEEIKYYNTGDSILSVKIFKISYDQNGDEIKTLVGSFSDSETSIVNIQLEVGDYRVEYYKDDIQINSENNAEYMWFDSTDIKIIPDTPKYVFEINGKKYENVDKLTRKAKLIFIADEDATVYYSFDSTDWIEGREVVLDKGGNYIVQFKCVKNGIESEEGGVTIKASLNLKIPDIFLLLIIVMVACGFVAVVYFIGKFLRRR